MGIFICLFVGLLIAILTGKVDEKAPITVKQVVLSAICFKGATVALVWRFVREHRISWAEGFGLRNARVHAIALGASAAVVFFPLAGLLQRISIEVLSQMGLSVTEQSAVEALRNSGHGLGLLAFVIITVIVAPLGEELLF